MTPFSHGCSHRGNENNIYVLDESDQSSCIHCAFHISMTLDMSIAYTKQKQ